MATEKQIQKLAGVIVEHMDFLNPLLGDDAQWAIQNPREATELYVKAIQNRKKQEQQAEKNLELVGTIVIPAMTEKFIVKDKFIVDTGKNAKVKIYGFGSNFENWFLDKVEEPIQEITLSSSKLLKYLLDSEIIPALGGEGKVETRLSHIYFLLSQQPNGEKGILLVNDWAANIFYVRDKDGNLCAVYACWSGVAWRLFALSVGVPGGWHDGRSVFSPQILA